MKYTKHLTAKQVKALEYETISTDLKVYLTRTLSDWVAKSEDGETVLLRKNKIINQSCNLQGRKIYVLEADDWGAYHPAEYAWHNGEFELVFRRLDTPQFIEFLGDLIEQQYFSIGQINPLLEREGASFRYTNDGGDLRIDVLSIKQMEELFKDVDGDDPETHPNIRVLIGRAEDALKKKDAAGVLHPCVSAMETLAKDILRDKKTDGKPFGKIFKRYRDESTLPAPILDYIYDQYNQRNSVPTAGHGSRLEAPTMMENQMVALIEMTKAFIRTEYRVSRQINVKKIKK